MAPAGGIESRAERARRGRRLRQKVPRSAHAAWTALAGRTDIVDLLASTDRTRVAALLPIRYARMATSPFAFLRGAAAVMARDLSKTPVSGLHAQMAGDAHLSNFGLFATPERDLVFDVNDFDETLRGPWEWDLKRLATSLVLVGVERGFRRELWQSAVRVALRSYRERMAGYAQTRYLDAWYSHLDLAAAQGLVRRKGRKLLRREVGRAVHRTGFHAYPKAVDVAGPRPRIRDDPPLIVHYRDAREVQLFHRLFEQYRKSLPRERRQLIDRYALADVAQKVVGVGSVGTRCSVGLFLADPDLADPLFLQVKQADRSVYEPYLGPSEFRNHAERVVVGEHLAQEASDIFLGWSVAGEHDFYVRQWRDMKLVSDARALNPRVLLGTSELCGSALARAHARTGDPAAIAGYLGSSDRFGEAILRFGEAYARQTRRDHAVLLGAIRSGKLPTAAAA